MRLFPKVSLLVAALGWVGCSGGDRLEPLDPEPPDVLDDVSVTRSAGLRFVAAPGAWDGAESILEEVMPIWVQLTNSSGRPIRVSYEDFRLVAPDGAIYTAASPTFFEGSAEVPVASLTRGPDRAFELPGVEYSWGYYPGPRVAYEYAYVYDNLVEVPLPTPGMLKRALREGVLEDGGVAAGFVYFDRIDFESDPVHLTFTLTDPATGYVVDVVNIPFDVEG